MESPGRAHALAFTPDGREVWVTMHDSNLVVVLDVTSGNVVTTITDVGRIPQHTWFTFKGDKGYMTVGGRGGVAVFDVVTKKEVRFYKTGPSPTYVIESPSGASFWVTNTGGDTISIIKPSTGSVQNVTVGPGPNHITFNSDGKYGYVTLGKANAVAAVEAATQQVIAKFDVGKVPHGIVFVPKPDPAVASLEKENKELSAKSSSLQDQLSNLNNILYGLGALVVIFLITTAFFAARRPKAKEEKK